jgi:hypothetical protein
MTEEPEEGIRLLLFVVLSLFVGVFFKVRPSSQPPQLPSLDPSLFLLLSS